MQPSSSDPEPSCEVASAGRGGDGGGMPTPPSFERDPVAYLTLVVSAVPAAASSSTYSSSYSRESLLHKLGGAVASAVSSRARTTLLESSNSGGGGGGGGDPGSYNGQLSPEVAFLYLQAAALYLPAPAYYRDDAESGSRSVLAATTTKNESSSPMALFNPFDTFSSSSLSAKKDPEAAGGGGNDGGAAAGGGRFSRGWGASADTDNAQQPSWAVSDFSSTDSTSAILEAVGYAAACCQPRSLVAQSGILAALATMLPRPPPAEVPLRNYDRAPTPSPRRRERIALVPLTPAQVEFVQACIYANEYKYGEDAVLGHWPRPTHRNVPVKLVLRYYYLRGTLHVGTGNWPMARRCFWTCLSIPADDMVSAIAVAAWKKLVLVHCRTMLIEGRNHKSSHPLNLPKAVPVGFSRFLNDALAPSSASRRSSASQMALDAAFTSAARGVGGRGSSSSSSLRRDEMDEDPEATMRMVEGSSDSEGPTDPSRRAAAAVEAGADLGVRAYGDLVNAYAILNQAQFQATMGEHEGVFRRDGNLGLVRQCWEQLLRRLVVFWSRVYSSISLLDLAAAVKVSVDKLNAILLGLSSELAWSIEVRDGIVNFPPAPRSADSALPSRDELIQLARLAQELDSSIEASPSYLSLSKRVGASLRSEAMQAAGSLGIEEMHVDHPH